MKNATLLLTVLLGGCTSQFQQLIEDVKENCHTTIDAQISGGITGIGGSGRFQQECWPLKPVVSEVPNG